MCKEEIMSWETYKAHIHNNFKDFSPDISTDILFRGQEDDYPLTSTLERFHPIHPYDIKRYYQDIYGVWKRIISYQGIQPGIPNHLEFPCEECEALLTINFEESSQHKAHSIYSFMVFLRQNGYPSPLLDWTESPYIAAYFAFTNPHLNFERDKTPVIYIYFRKYSNKDDYGINQLGSEFITDKKHHNQQAQYSLSFLKKEKNSYSFKPYPKDLECFKKLKFEINEEERKSILFELYQMNIHPYSIFGTQKTLLQSLAIKNYLNYPYTNRNTELDLKKTNDTLNNILKLE